MKKDPAPDKPGLDIYSFRRRDFNGSYDPHPVSPEQTSERGARSRLTRSKKARGAIMGFIAFCKVALFGGDR